MIVPGCFVSWTALYSTLRSHGLGTPRTAGRPSTTLSRQNILKWRSWRPPSRRLLWILHIRKVSWSFNALEHSAYHLIVDYHRYDTPNWFTKNAFLFDDYPRNGTQYFVGQSALFSAWTLQLIWSRRVCGNVDKSKQRSW